MKNEVKEKGINTRNKQLIKTTTDLKSIAEEICKVTKFVEHEPSKTEPYAMIDVVCSNGDSYKIPILHKVDLLHLKEAFAEKGEDEEVWASYSESMRGFLFKFLHFVLPKFFVEIHPVGSFDKWTVSEEFDKYRGWEFVKQTRARKKWDPVANYYL